MMPLSFRMPSFHVGDKPLLHLKRNGEAGQPSERNRK
jgi:hypothetical protein